MSPDLVRNIKKAFTWLIIGAVILVGIAFLGFCGGCRENRCIDAFITKTPDPRGLSFDNKAEYTKE